MLAGEREREREREESFVLKRSKSASPFLQFLSFPHHHPSNYQREQNRTGQGRKKRKPRNKTKEKESSEADRGGPKSKAAMGDASSNCYPVLTATGGDAGQSSFGGGGGGAITNSAAAGGFVALDVGALTSSLAGEVGPLPSEAAAVASPRPPRTPKVVRSLSRKGERKPADGDGNGNAVGGGGGSERPQLFVHVAAGDIGGGGDGNGTRLVVHTPVAGTPSGKSRRLGRRPAPWLDPRRVVFLFATLSSVGTLILLYFTLSMNRTDSSGDGAAASSDAR